MSREPKMCCNCLHCARWRRKDGIECHCDLTDKYLGYLDVMNEDNNCKHWEKETKWDLQKKHDAEIRADERAKTIDEVLKNIEIGIEATGHYDQYATGFCNALIWLRSCITSEEPQFLEQLKEQKGGAKVTCINCIRYGDLHSSCDLARDMKIDEDSPICERFKGKE